MKIGERVTIKRYENLPEERKNPRLGCLCGRHGEIVDILASAKLGGTCYSVMLDDTLQPSTVLFTEDMFETLPPVTFDVKIGDGLLVLRMQKGNEEIRVSHAHIFHDGYAGFAQALSYAAKKLFTSFEESKEYYGGNSK